MISFFDLLYPPRCPICDGVRLSDEPVCCPSCADRVSYIAEPFCMCCGRPLSRDDCEFCYDCSKKKRSFSDGVSLGRYDGVLKESIIRFKFFGREEYACWYTEELLRRQGERLRRFDADIVVPVPMHRRKEKKRGYNQARTFAELLAAELSIPLADNVLVRSRYTEPQKELNDVARLQNLLQAFAVDEDKLSAYKKNHSGYRVILADDIFTTGSTVEACAQLLKKAGAEAVAPVTVAVAGGYSS